MLKKGKMHKMYTKQKRILLKCNAMFSFQNLMTQIS